MPDECNRLFIGFLSIEQHLADILAQIIADGANDDIAFLIDEKWRRLFASGVLYRLPQREQVIQIPLQFLLIFTDAGSTDDHAHAVGDV